MFGRNIDDTCVGKRKAAADREPTYVGQHLVVHPGVCFGKMTFRGTRVPVETILYYLATGHTFEYLHRSWPQVSAEASFPWR